MKHMHDSAVEGPILLLSWFNHFVRFPDPHRQKLEIPCRACEVRLIAISQLQHPSRRSICVFPLLVRLTDQALSVDNSFLSKHLDITKGPIANPAPCLCEAQFSCNCRGQCMIPLNNLSSDGLTQFLKILYD
jgi:hypothetical protein